MDSTIYAIGLAKSFASYTLHVTALSVETGELLTMQNIPSSIEEDVVKFVTLTPKLANKPQGLKGSINAGIVDVGLSGHGLFVVRKEDGSASVFRLDQGREDLKELCDRFYCHSKWVPSSESTSLLDAADLRIISEACVWKGGFARWAIFANIPNYLPTTYKLRLSRMILQTVRRWRPEAHPGLYYRI